MGPGHLKYLASFENDMSKMNVSIQALRKQRFLCVRAKGVLWAQHTHSGEGLAEKLEKCVLCVLTFINMLAPKSYGCHSCYGTASKDFNVAL